MPKQKVWLVIEKNVYGSTQTFSVIKNHVDIDEAMKYKVYLEALNDRDGQTYFLASDVDTVMNKVVTSHNKSVANGSYYERHPEIKKPDDQKENEVNNEQPF